MNESHQKYYADIVQQDDVAALLMAAESSLNLATQHALAATAAVMSPFAESAQFTDLMNDLRIVQTKLHRIRMAGGPVEVLTEVEEIIEDHLTFDAARRFMGGEICEI